MHFITKYAFGAVFVAITFSFSTAGAHAKHQCKKLSVLGDTRMFPIPILSKSAAEDRAKKLWEGAASKKYGGYYGVWDAAKSRKTSCTKTTNGVGGYFHHCSASGIPCRTH